MNCLIIDLKQPVWRLKWDEFVEKFEHGHHHQSNYINALTIGLKQTPYPLVCEENNEIVGVLPLFGAKSPIFGNNLTSLPHLNYGGALCNSDEIRQLLYDKARDLANKEGYTNILIRDVSPLPSFAETNGWAEQTHKVNMCYTLPEDIKKIGRGNAKKKAKLRSQARLAERKADELGVSVSQRFGGQELIGDFYTVFSRHMRDLGTPVLGRDFFEAQFEQGLDIEITIVYWDDAPVACGWLLKHSNKRVSIPWASTLYWVNPYSINAYMYHGIIDRLINLNIEVFDFGRSTRNEGTYKFKEQWGADEFPCYWHVFEKGATKEQMLNTQPSKVMTLLITCWKRTPQIITNILGPMLIRKTSG